MRVYIRTPKLSTVQSRWCAVHRSGQLWRLEAWRYLRGQRSWSSKRHGEGAASLWSALSALCPKGTNTWVVGWHIYEDLCWAGMIDRVQSGALIIADHVSSDVRASGGAAARRMVGAMVCENPPTIIDARLEGAGKVRFLDLRNWGVTPDMITDADSDVCIDDVVQAAQDYLCLVQATGMGQLKSTAAAQGWYAYRHKHMPYTLTADDAPEARAMERAAYFGGRCEARRLGRLPGMVFHMDVSAMYTGLGSCCAFPTRLICVTDGIAIDELSRDRDVLQHIADVTVCTAEPILPCRTNGMVIYPTGTFRTTLAQPELALAAKRGLIVRVHSNAVYSVAQIFESWADWYFGALSELDMLGLAHMAPALKLAVNSTYGKIGQRSRAWIDCPGSKPCAPYDQWWQRHPVNGAVVQWRSIDGAVQYLDSGGESHQSMPAISATMCSYGRVMLWRLLTIAGHSNVYYYDTDGLMVSQAGFDRLCAAEGVVGTGPGRLRIREQSDDIRIYGIKHYRFGQRYCCAGVPDRNILLSPDGAEYDQHTPMSSSLWHRRAFEHGYDRRLRKYAQRYRHGVVIGGDKVIPYVMGSIPNEQSDSGSSAGGAETYGILGGQYSTGRQSVAAGDMPAADA